MKNELIKNNITMYNCGASRKRRGVKSGGRRPKLLGGSGGRSPPAGSGAEPRAYCPHAGDPLVLQGRRARGAQAPI